MIHDWERAVAAVLDHFGIDSCTLMGVSLGGYLAPRAAAFEPEFADSYGCRMEVWTMCHVGLHVAIEISFAILLDQA